MAAATTTLGASAEASAPGTASRAPQDTAAGQPVLPGVSSSLSPPQATRRLPGASSGPAVELQVTSPTRGPSAPANQPPPLAEEKIPASGSPKVKPVSDLQRVPSTINDRDAEFERNDIKVTQSPFQHNIEDEQACYCCKVRVRNAVGWHCGLARVPMDTLGAHFSILIPLIIFGALTALFYLVDIDEKHTIVLENTLWRWFFAGFCIFALMYVGNLLQLVLEATVERLLGSTGVWIVFFVANAIVTSTSLLITIITVMATWEELLSFSEKTTGDINQLLRVALVLALTHIVRKVYKQHTIYSFNRANYMKRLEDIKFREDLIRDLTKGKEVPELVEERASTLFDFQKLFKYFHNSTLTVSDRTAKHAAALENERRGYETEAAINKAQEVNMDSLERRIVELQRQIFATLGVEPHGYAVLADFEARYPSEISSRAFDVFDITRDGEVHRGDVRQVLRNFFADRQSLHLTLNNFANLSEIVGTVINTIYWIVMVVVIAAMYGYNFETLLLTFGTLVVSISFALGSTIKNWVESVVFLLVEQPFVVGDRVQIDGQEKMWVQEVNVVSTTFRTTFNKIIIVPNFVLAQKMITNLKRSKEAVIEIKISVDFYTPTNRINLMFEKLLDVIKQERLSWKPELSTFISSLDRNITMELSMWLTHRLDHSQSAIIYNDVSLINNEIRNIMAELGIVWRPATQRITISGDESGMMIYRKRAQGGAGAAWGGGGGSGGGGGGGGLHSGNTLRPHPFVAPQGVEQPAEGTQSGGGQPGVAIQQQLAMPGSWQPLPGASHVAVPALPGTSASPGASLSPGAVAPAASPPLILLPGASAPIMLGAVAPAAAAPVAPAAPLPGAVAVQHQQQLSLSGLPVGAIGSLHVAPEEDAMVPGRTRSTVSYVPGHSRVADSRARMRKSRSAKQV